MLGAGAKFWRSSDGPADPEAWRRVVHRRPPNNFRVKFLPPKKHGNSYNFGFRIYPIKDAYSPTTSRATSSDESVGSADEYDIWRKWEDCLWFQETLESLYTRAARVKRSRLAAGKGLKKNGVYIQSDHAASWDSLPFGPNPRDIAYDIHEYIPKLTKKATLFRADQDTIDHRYHELRMMMQTLFQADLPTLVKELKCSHAFTDFFGVWRRDIDLARKLQSLQGSAADRSRTSFSSSLLSVFPISPSSAKSMSAIKGKAPETTHVPRTTSTHSDSSSEDAGDQPRPGRLMNRIQGNRSGRSRASSFGSLSSSSSPSTPVMVPRQLPSGSRQPLIASQEVPIMFGHNPHVLGSDRGSFTLESLPEDRELCSSPKSGTDGSMSPERSRSPGRTNRNAKIYIPSSPGSLESPELPRKHLDTLPTLHDGPPPLPARSLARYSRASLRSTHSSATMRAAAYMDELSADYCLSSPTPEPGHYPRASVSSLASLVTNSSVDAVIPRSERSSRAPANNMRRLREYEPWSEDDSQSEDQGDVILDAYFHDVIVPCPQTPCGFPETPCADETMYHFAQEQSSATLGSLSGRSDRRSSLTTSISSGSTSSSGNPAMLSIKAVHEDNIVMLRLPRHITFDELRQKIYDKFVQVDKSTICDTFAIALIEQAPVERVEQGRPRAGSVSSIGSASTKSGALYFIASQAEWDGVAATHHGKMFLRIIGSRE